MPPMVQRACVEGSTGKNRPCGLSAALRWPSTMPGSTVARRRSGSISSTLRRYFEQSMTKAALTGAAAARQDGDATLARDRDSGRDILDRARHENADGLDLVDGRISRITAAVGAREQHLAPRLPPQLR